MPDSRMLVHMTPQSEKIENNRDYNVTISLGDDSEVSATEKV